jgi:hypothetical protein
MSSCKTSFKKWKVKMWKRSFLARLPSKRERRRCENEAFVRDVPQKVQVEYLKTTLSCDESLKKCKWKMWIRRFRARHPSKSESGRCENDGWTVSSTAGPIREWSRSSQDRPGPARRTRFPIHLPGHVLSCKTQHFVHLLTLKIVFRARLPSKSESGRCENEAFVRVAPEKVKVEDVKTTLSCETSLQKWSGRCENEALVRDFPQKVKAGDVKTKLLVMLW